MEKKTIFQESSKDFEKQDLPIISVSRLKGDGSTYNFEPCQNLTDHQLLKCLEEETCELNETIWSDSFGAQWDTSFSGTMWGRTYLMKDYDKKESYYDLRLPGDEQYEIEIFDNKYHVEKSIFMVEYQREFIFVEKGQFLVFFIRIEQTNHLPSTSGCNSDPEYSFLECTKVQKICKLSSKQIIFKDMDTQQSWLQTSLGSLC